jgi:hypothetical protein
MKLEWWEHKDFHWMLTDSDNYVLAKCTHLPTGWRLLWRPSRNHKMAECVWPDTELEEAKAWAIAMIRMSQ